LGYLAGWGTDSGAFFLKAEMENMDEKLMNFVNLLGLTTFLSIVAYHFVTATPKDADT